MIIYKAALIPQVNTAQKRGVWSEKEMTGIMSAKLGLKTKWKWKQFDGRTLKVRTFEGGTAFGKKPWKSPSFNGDEWSSFFECILFPHKRGKVFRYGAPRD